MSARSFFLATLLLVAGLAGCVQPGAQLDASTHTLADRLPVERFTGAVLEDLDFTASDGGTIAATVYLPEGAPEGATFGAIVQLSPYFTNLYRVDTDGLLPEDKPFNQTRVGLYVSHGFAYVAASVPGTGRSGGCFEIGSLTEQTRMAEFIDWIGQQPWSNGNVGVMGVSYDGTTPWQVAIHNPEHLRTIVPIAGISDMYRYEYQDGAPYAYWGAHFLPDYLLGVGWAVQPLYGVVNPQPSLVLEDACPQAAQQFTTTYKTYATGKYDAFWQERNFSAKFGEINASVLLVHGLIDWNVKPDHADVWDLVQGEKRAWLGQWPHATPDRNRAHPEWSRPDWNATTLAWFDHYLNGVDNGIPDALPPVWAQDTAGNWIAADAWPPAQSRELTLYLQPGGFSEKPADAAPATLVTTPVPQPWFVRTPGAGLGPHSPEPTVARFVSEPMAEDLRIAGSPDAFLQLSVDRPGHSFAIVKLFNISEDGTWWFLNEGGRGLAQRDGRERNDDVPPNEVLSIGVNLHPSMAVVHKGERLGMLVAFDDPDWFYFNGNAPIAKLFMDAKNPSRLVLPVLPADHPRVPADEAAGTNPYFRS